MLDQAINSPVAIIAILALVIVMLREIFWFVRNSRGHTPSNPSTRQWDNFGSTLEKVSDNLDKSTMILDRLADQMTEVRDTTTEIAMRCKLHLEDR